MILDSTKHVSYCLESSVRMIGEAGWQGAVEEPDHEEWVQSADLLSSDEALDSGSISVDVVITSECYLYFFESQSLSRLVSLGS